MQVYNDNIELQTNDRMEVAQFRLGEVNGSYVISRTESGETLSVYSDNCWDMTPFSGRKRKVFLDFSWWLDSRAFDDRNCIIIDEMKYLIFILLWNDVRKSPAINTIVKYLNLFSKMATFAYSENLLIKDVISDVKLVNKYINYAGPHHSNKLLGILSLLFEIGEERVGFKVVGQALLGEIRNVAASYSSSRNQHSPVPTRIYSELIANLINHLNDFSVVSDRYLGVVKACGSDDLFGRHEWTQKNKFRAENGYYLPKEKLQPALITVLNDGELINYFHANLLSTNINGLSRGLTEVRLVCKLLIHVFSGMRDEEVLSLPFDCLKIFEISGRKHFRICGTTTKFNRGKPKNCTWVTSEVGAQAIEIVQKIARLIYELQGVDLTSDNEGEFNLFVGTGSLPFVNSNTINDKNSFKDLDVCRYKKFIMRIMPRISEQDIRELEMIDPHRAWSTEDKMQIGEIWGFNTHQLRRSLALYASRSGLVSLPSLKRQLKHITEEMSLYYSSGSAYAVDILNMFEPNIVKEYQLAQLDSESLAYLSEVVFSSERLYGGHGTWVEQNLARTSTPSEILRSDTFARVARGDLAFKGSYLGGCTKIGACNEKPMRSVIPCLDCNKSVIKISRLDVVIMAQEKLVESIERDTIEWRSEKNDLDVLTSARNKMINRHVEKINE